jgi:hypothetical protein
MSLSGPLSFTQACVSAREKASITFWLLLLAGLLVYAPQRLTAQTVVSLKQTPRAVQEGTARLVGPYLPENKLRLAFALRPPHMEEEEQFLNQLQDRNSPLFHHYLSEEEWNQRFAPSAEDEQAVASWAASAGLTITQRYKNRLLVDVEAPVSVIEKALNVSINTYDVGGKQHFSNDRDPSIPAALASVLSAVMGLNNIEVARTFSKGSQNFTGPDYSPGPSYTVGSHLASDASAKKTGATGIGGANRPDWYSEYTPYDLWAPGGYSYGIVGPGGLANLQHCCNPLNNPNNSPPEASIAIAIWGDFSDSDFQEFLGFQGVAGNVQRYFVDGTPPCCSPETTLDVEWSTAMANSFGNSANTAEIHVYEGADNQWQTMADVLNHMLTDGHARVLSMSWGAAELYGAPPSVMDTYHSIFAAMSGQGWTLVAASGDGGATTDCANHLSVSYPASDPYVTAAGGTTLEGGQYGYVADSGWAGGGYGCANNDGGGGGGCSAYYPAPGYQGRPACGANSRSLPDVALNADWVNTPQDLIYNGGVYAAGGTSVVAPEMAGFYAQSNAYLLYIGSIVGDTCGSSYSAPCAPLGTANWYLYSEGYQPTAPHYPFYDITTGCNGNDITQQYGLTPFCAGPGYDMVTGWGSANMLQLAWMMNAYLAGDGSGPLTTFSGPQIDRWYTTDQWINWTITGTSLNGHLPNGVSGYSYYWDTDPGDPYSEPTPSIIGSFADQNSFYHGPGSPNSTSGTENLSGAFVGCHSLIVRAWDNAGQASVTPPLGPLCYDAFPPNTFATLAGNLQGQYYSGPVLVSLTAYDDVFGIPGSGVASTLYQINGDGVWQTYSAPFFLAAPGVYSVAFYSMDNAGNVELIQFVDLVISSNSSREALTVTKSGNGSGTITSLDDGINCGSVCSYNYYYQEQVTLTATAAQGSVLTGWAGCDLSFGNSCSVHLTANRTATAIFNQVQALQFIPVTPCRVVDTRNANGPLGGPPIQGQSSRDFPLPSGSCGIPANAAAYSLNVTAVPQGTLVYMTTFPTGLTLPLTSTLNSPDGRVKANAAIVPAGTSGSVSVFASQTSNVLLDIDGYFVPLPNPQALAFYPLTPCRVADTRNPNGPLGGPSLQGGAQRNFPLPASSCNIPSSAQAYSLNFTVVPKGTLDYLTAWPAGQSQPVVSTLNDRTGTIVANAAVVPAGTSGAIEVFVTDNTDLVIDVDGYFAAPGQNGLSLYTLAPCRALDTRSGSGAFVGTLATNFVTGPCSLPSSALGYVMNATAIPLFPLGYLTLWPDGENQPNVSTLNAKDGITASNMAILPSVNGSIDAFASGYTHLILDVSSYFAP